MPPARKTEALLDQLKYALDQAAIVAITDRRGPRRHATRRTAAEPMRGAASGIRRTAPSCPGAFPIIQPRDS
jgi:hypothetical protein